MGTNVRSNLRGIADDKIKHKQKEIPLFVLNCVETTAAKGYFAHNKPFILYPSVTMIIILYIMLMSILSSIVAFNLDHSETVIIMNAMIKRTKPFAAKRWQLDDFVDRFISYSLV